MSKPDWRDIHLDPPEGKDPVLVWHAYQGCLIMTPEDCLKNRFVTHWMNVPGGKWIRTSKRRPGKNDADIWGCVIARNAWYDQLEVTGWRQFADDRKYSHWQRTPEPP